MKKGATTMIENFGLLSGAVQGTEIYLMSTDALSPKTSMKRSALGIKTLNRNFAVLFSRSSSPSSSFSSPPSPPMTVAMNAFLCPGTAYWRRPKLLPAIARGEFLNTVVRQLKRTPYYWGTPVVNLGMVQNLGLGFFYSRF